MKTPTILLGPLLVALATTSVALAQVPAAQPAPPPAPAPTATETLSPDRFAQEIARFAELDSATPPPSCAYLFVGSSSIRFWKSLSEDMAPYPVINRGFGGAHVSDVDYFFEKVVTPYKAKAIFFYAGDNDLWAGKTADRVLADFKTFMTLKTAKLGQTPVYFIAIKPSKQRLSQLALQDQVNQAIRAMGATRKDLRFVDVAPPMLEAGVPKDIFVADGLHMTPEGYAIWTSVVRPVVELDARENHTCKGEPPARKKPAMGWLFRKKT